MVGDSAVDVVVGLHMIVVVNGLFGMQGGSDVDEVGVPVPIVVVGSGMAVVVVVAERMVVVVAGGGALGQPRDWSSEVKTLATAGKPANATRSDWTSRQIGSRNDGSSWATLPRLPTV